MELPETVTQAYSKNKLRGAPRGFGQTLSTARSIPYAERYRGFSGVYETPAQRLQKAAKDEAERAKKER